MCGMESKGNQRVCVPDEKIFQISVYLIKVLLMRMCSKLSLDSVS